MTKIRRIDFSPDEWLSGTAELSDEDRGVYITVCALIYSRGGPISYELLKGHSHSHGNKLQSALDRLERGGKIVRNGSEIDQKRCENELEKARKRHEKALENGAKGGRPKELDKPDGSSGGKTNHQPSTINHQKEGESPPQAPPLLAQEGGDDDAAKRGDLETRQGARRRKPSAARSSSAERGLRLPEDWQPSDADREFAAARGLDVDEVADEFRDYWLPLPGPKAKKLDWSKTFQNRCRELARRTKSYGKPRRSAVENLYLGAMLAADALDAREAERTAREGGADKPPALTLLDGGRSAGG